MKRIVLDTNVLLMSLPKISPYRPIFDGLIAGTFQLLVTEGILNEYREMVAERTLPEIAQNLSELLTQLANVERINVYYNWRLITQDPDDNKFVDCAISGNASYIVTNDHHFNILKKINFPKVSVINADDFLHEMLIEAN
jgi:putative PIN family toxin of toxin-antitoxin system